MEEEIAKIDGFRIEKAEKEPKIDENGIPVLRADTFVSLRIFGSGFIETTELGLTDEINKNGTHCNMRLGHFELVLTSSTNALVEVKMPKNSVDLYLCVSNKGVR